MIITLIYILFLESSSTTHFRVLCSIFSSSTVYQKTAASQHFNLYLCWRVSGRMEIMMKIQHKCAICLCLCILMVLCQFNSAYAVVSKSGGPDRYDIDLSDIMTGEGYEITDEGLHISPGGFVSYNLFLPFNSNTIQVEADLVDPCELLINLNGNDIKSTIRFRRKIEQFGAGKMYRKGDLRLNITAKSDITITSFRFMKESRQYANMAGLAERIFVTDLTPYEDAMQTAVIINENSSVIKVNGAKRYINYEDSKELPYFENGTTYLPIKTLARALGYYYEELYDRDYALMRSNSDEWVFKEGKTYRQINFGEYTEISPVFIKRNNKFYANFRYFAESIGKTVEYKDGYIVADYSAIVNKILNTDIFEQLKDEYSNYIELPKNGNVYYVSKSGSDDNDGSKEHPFLTVNKAGEAATAGDTVIVGEGVYHETFKPKNDGTAENPIIFKAADGESVTISALEEIKSVPNTEGNILVYDVDYDLGDGRNQVFYKGEALAEARHPNAHTSLRQFAHQLNLSPLWATQGNIQVSLDDKMEAFSDTDLDQPQGYWKGATFVSLHGSGWGMGTAKIADSDNGRLFLNNVTDEWWYAATADLLKWDYGYITGSKNCIDISNEWYLDGNEQKLYIYPPEGETGKTLKLEMKARQVTVDIADRSYVQLKNINTIGGGMKLNESQMCVINGGTHKYVCHYTYSEDQHYGYIDDFNTFDPNGAPKRGELGIYVGGSDNAVINTQIKYSAASGIYGTGTFAYIENNYLSECGYMASYVGGIFMAPDASKTPRTKRGGFGVYNNTAEKSGRSVFQVAGEERAWASDGGNTVWLANEIAYNDFRDGSINARDTGTVYLHGVSFGNERLRSQIHHNLVSSSWNYDALTVGSAANFGFYFDNWVNMIDCYDNITFNTSEDSIFSDGDHINNGGTAYARVDRWNNILPDRILSNGKAELTDFDYPNQKRFFSGCSLNSGEYLENYNKFGKQSRTYGVGNVTASDGVERENGIVKLKNVGDWICFKDVDFTDANTINLVYKADAYSTGDTFEIIVGDSMESGRATSVTLSTTCYNLDAAVWKPLNIRGCSGIKNVYIKATSKYKSANICAIQTSKTDDEKIEDVTAVKRYAGNYNADVGTVTKAEKVYPQADLTKPAIGNTKKNVCVRYDNVNVTGDFSRIRFNLAVADENAGNIVSLYCDDTLSAPIATFITESTGGADIYKTIDIPLNSKIEKGNHKLYMKFANGKNCNIWWFKLYETNSEVMN